MATLVLPLTFTPSWGDFAGQAFNLPPVTQNPFTAIAHVDRNADAYQDLEEMDGVFLTAGTQPMFKSYGEISGIFDLFPGWLTNNGNKNYYAGGKSDAAACLNAVVEFQRYVVDGGLGTLTLVTPAGANFTGYTCNAIIDGDVQTQYLNGNVRAQITATFMVPSCYWTAQPGNVLIPIH